MQASAPYAAHPIIAPWPDAIKNRMPPAGARPNNSRRNYLIKYLKIEKTEPVFAASAWLD